MSNLDYSTREMSTKRWHYSGDPVGFKEPMNAETQLQEVDMKRKRSEIR